MPLPTTLDDVIARLEAIVAECTARGDRLGYFAALHHRATQGVREAIRSGEFEDGARAERLEVLLAGRYLEAYDRYRGGELPSRAWLVAFRAADDSRPAIVQHLLAGLSAHLHLDLGVAAARTYPGEDLSPLRADFERLGDVLASFVPSVEREGDESSPRFSSFLRIAPGLELRAVGFSIHEARARAWQAAQVLAPLSPRTQVAIMVRHDAEAARLGETIVKGGVITRTLRAREPEGVPENIRTIVRGEFRVVIPAQLPSVMPGP